MDSVKLTVFRFRWPYHLMLLGPNSPREIRYKKPCQHVREKNVGDISPKPEMLRFAQHDALQAAQFAFVEEGAGVAGDRVGVALDAGDAARHRGFRDRGGDRRGHAEVEGV